MRPTPPDAPLVVQVSRWDALKDPVGVMRGAADDPSLGEAHLMLAGPRPASVVDDPEADAVLAEVLDVWRRLPTKDRSRVHIANLPTDDVEANAIIVNALQRRADVVVQKSLAEGFGLTVTEAMWKERPIVASAVGSIRDQIRDGVHGLLVDPRDLTAFGDAVHGLLADPRRLPSLGRPPDNASGPTPCRRTTSAPISPCSTSCAESFPGNAEVAGAPYPGDVTDTAPPVVSRRHPSPAPDPGFPAAVDRQTVSMIGDGIYFVAMACRSRDRRTTIRARSRWSASPGRSLWCCCCSRACWPTASIAAACWSPATSSDWWRSARSGSSPSWT